ncbi:MAG: pyrroline-5-carboxylate reductase dimerization domain-containing protein, partial [Nitrososphaerota archaeon]|nr:pyrroline-5-carboxylate reductase dimerization domain-containing protein [Nitrososphaerota archaeon]
MLLESNQHPALLRDMVATPAGTTIEALLKLERGGFRAMLVDAITAATEKAEQLERLNLSNKGDEDR